MSTWIKQTQIVRQIAKDLLQSKRNNYRQDLLKFKIHQHPNLQYKNFKVKNENKQELKATLINSKTSRFEICIIFMHGYGSTRLEALTVLNQLPEQIDLCCFDFSGSGKSQGNITTFGLKQTKDLKPIISYLKQAYNYKKFILWGRSMGAVAAFTFSSQNLNQLSNDVIFQVIDSPFSSFQSICYHQAKQGMKLPDLFIQFGINILKDHFKNNLFDPFKIDLIKLAPQCNTPSLFIYSEDDQMIPSENSLQIIQKLPNSCYFEKLLIQQNHNCLRKQQTIVQIFRIIKKSSIKFFNKQSNVRESKRKNYLSLYGSNVNYGIQTYVKFRNGAIFCSVSKTPAIKDQIIKKQKINKIRNHWKQQLTHSNN